MNTSIVLILLIAVTALVSFKGFNDVSFFSKYDFHVGRIQQGERYRMFTSAFLHGDLMHLAFNMFTLFLFGQIVITLFGTLYFLLIYIGSMFIGNLLTLHFYKNMPHYRAIGASGAVMGIVYTAILLNPNMSLYLFFIPIPIPAYIFGIGYLIYSIYGMKANNDRIGHAAHFGGAIGGLLLTLLKVPRLVLMEPFIVGVLLIPIVILFFLMRTNKI